MKIDRQINDAGQVLYNGKLLLEIIEERKDIFGSVEPRMLEKALDILSEEITQESKSVAVKYLPSTLYLIMLFKEMFGMSLYEAACFNSELD